MERLKIESRYKIHIKKQEENIIIYKNESKIKLPYNLNYKEIGGLSKECILALEAAKPDNLANAAKIPGITPLALTSVLLYTKKIVRNLVDKKKMSFSYFEPEKLQF